MILLIDIGNTRVKWATLTRGKLGRMRAALHGRRACGDDGAGAPRAARRRAVSSS